MPFEATEFTHLTAIAADLGLRDSPVVRRQALELPDGRTLSALRFGTGMPEVTFLHGAGLNAHTWDRTALLLGRSALAIDLAGHGDSSWRDDRDYSPRTLAADIALALREWTLQPQVLVGHSLGGMTAAAVASGHPELVRQVILVDITPTVVRGEGPAILRRFYEVTVAATRAEFVDRAESFGFGGSREETERGVFFNTRIRLDGRVEWKHHFARLAPESLATADEGGETPPLDLARWEDVEGIRAPVTLVRGTQGFVTDADVAEFRARVPTASVVEIDAGHNVQETDPGPLSELIGKAVPAAND